MINILGIIARIAGFHIWTGVVQTTSTQYWLSGLQSWWSCGWQTAKRLGAKKTPPNTSDLEVISNTTNPMRKHVIHRQNGIMGALPLITLVFFGVLRKMKSDFNFQKTCERYSKCNQEIFPKNQLLRRNWMADSWIIAFYYHSRVLRGFLGITDLEPKVDTGQDDEHRKYYHIQVQLQESERFWVGHFHFFESLLCEIVIYEPVSSLYI